MSQFEGVTVVKRANVYFDGKVTSRTVIFPDGEKKTLGIMLIIALIGIANTLSLSILERTRELGLLRAVGMSRKQLIATIWLESAIIAIFGTLMGLVLGIAFSGALTVATAIGALATRAVPSTVLIATSGTNGSSPLAARARSLVRTPATR